MNIQTNLKEHSLPNGLQAQFNKANAMGTPAQFNGLSSSQPTIPPSSHRIAAIPPSQLPPSRPSIPSNQLPPSANINQVTQNYNHLSITPTVSPGNKPFNTSTPKQNTEQNLHANISPINTTEPSYFKHSTQSYFTSVASNTNSVSNVNNVPLRPNASISNQFPTQNEFAKADQQTKESGVYLQNPLGTYSQPDIRQTQFVSRAQQHPTVPQFPPQQSTEKPVQSYNLIPNQVPLSGQQRLMAPATANTIPPPRLGYNVQPHLNAVPPPQDNRANAPPSVNTAPKTNFHSNRYPSNNSTVPNLPPQSNVAPPQGYSNVYQNQPPRSYANTNNHYPKYEPTTNVVNSGFDKAWGYESCDLLQCTNVLPVAKVEPPRINLGQALLENSNCSPDIFRCTMTKIPDTSSLLQKSRLPLGVLIHPFKDLDHLPVIQCSTIVRCRACRTYINPFVYFVDTKRWKCNLCYRVNELPEEFQFDPVSKTYGDPSRRIEIKSSTIEYIATSEYLLRPPPPAVYLFLLDISHAAIESGYLHIFCDVLSSSLTSLPGDSRKQVGFIAFNSALHFYSLAEGLTQPHEMTVLDIEDIFLPCPDNLIVNLHERKELITDLLAQLPTRFNNSFDTGSALGAALQAAHKMISATGGRITVFQASLPTNGPGALTPREDPSQRAGADVQHLNPANDFYKRLALDCSGQQIAVDLFIVNSQYVDLATISGISRFSGGCIHHFPLFKASRTLHAEKLEHCFKRYLTRKIGFEAVMRIRCTRGLAIHTFHGNFFVRSTDLLSLPNVNPDAGFGMQVAIEESLSDLKSVCFQAALLYTSSKGERKIRVHTLCVPIASTLSDIINSADQQCIIGLLAKMAVDRSMRSSLSDAREAFINVAIDILSSYKLSLNLGSPASGLLAAGCLRLLPLYISALLKYVAFRTGTSTRLDDRVKSMCDMKTLPLYLLIQNVYPDLYPVHNLGDQHTTLNGDGEAVPQPPHIQLSARCLDSKGAFLMDMGDQIVVLVCPGVSQTFLQETLGVPNYNSISEEMYELPVLSNPHNQRLHNFINSLNDEKPYVASLHIIRDNSPHRNVFIERLIEDRVENALSYHEFLQHLKTQVK